MTIRKLSAVFVAGAIVLGSLNTSASAASPITNAFLANAVPNIDFLDRSSRFALTHSKNARLRDFARSEAREQTLAANDIDSWIETSKAPTVVASADGAPVLTGRSVAVDNGVERGRVIDSRLPMGQEDLDKLEGFEAAEFDALYKKQQLDALNQVETDYRDYLAKGDDSALLAVAKRELPKVQRRIAQLARM